MEKGITQRSFENIINQFDFPKNIEGEYSPLVLAFVGDSIYEIYIRTFILSKGNMSPNDLHKMASSYAKAKSQAKVMLEITQYLTEEEIRISKRGRNAKSGTVPKNADVIDYRNATGLECLIGYLYLKGEFDRLIEILNISIKIVNS